MKKLVILASGSGSNAENIIKYFNGKNISVSCLLTNKKNAGALERCQRMGTPAFYFNRHAYNSGAVLHMLRSQRPDLIILAGFLWKIPESFIKAFPNKIINIHPALLPKYGGKGMYGMHVHQAVKANDELQTGITIHYVNENYDEGNIIYQSKTELAPEDTLENIAKKVHALEYEHYPKVIEKLLKENG